MIEVTLEGALQVAPMLPTQKADGSLKLSVAVADLHSGVANHATLKAAGDVRSGHPHTDRSRCADPHTHSGESGLDGLSALSCGTSAMTSLKIRLACVSLLSCLTMSSMATTAELYVSPTGSDAGPGTKAKPFATIAHARDVVRKSPKRAKEPFKVILRGGVYRLPEALVFTAADSGAPNAPIEYCSAEGEQAVLSGGQLLTGLKWEPHQNGILKAKVPAGFTSDQLFVNSALMPMARYPNFSASQRIFNGTAADAFSDERVARWQAPAGGFIHAMHKSHWGGMHYQITGKDASGKLTYEGGWQNNRPSAPHPNDRFVENIFEELDAPGEWFLDTKAGVLYLYPPAGLDLAKATLEAVCLRSLVELRGTEQQPVRFLSLKGLTFRHAARTFMDNKEPLLRTDWTVYRGGAVFLNGTEDCRIMDCDIDHVGGNALFVNHLSTGQKL